MANMSYCRFENTVGDLQDCFDNWDLDDDASEHEISAQKRLLRLCEKICAEYSNAEFFEENS